MASNHHAPRDMVGLSLRLHELAIHTGDLKHSCLGCGYEHNCGIHGCAVLLAAEDAVVKLKAYEDLGFEPEEYKRTMSADIIVRCAAAALGVTAQEWISVKDMLPKNNEIVIICTDKNFIYAGELIGDTWFLDNDSWTATVTHWMPLPQPPNGDSDA